MTETQNTRVDITPETKVGALLDDYPELEELLIQTAPVFKKLKNPILRRTVAKVATLHRAADIAEIPVRELVRTLRQAVGLEDDTSPVIDSLSPEVGKEEIPGWVRTAQVVEEFDIDAMLERGEIPIGPVTQRARGLNQSEVLQLNVSFRPTPLLDMLQSSGFSHHSVRNSAEGYTVYIGQR